MARNHSDPQGSSCAYCNTETDGDFNCTHCGADCCGDECKGFHEAECEEEE